MTTTTESTLRPESLFEPRGLAKFVDEFYGRLPLALARSAVPFCDLVGLGDLERLFNGGGSNHLIAKHDQQWAGPTPRSRVDLDDLASEGYTLVIRHAERQDSRLKELAGWFSDAFGGPVDVQVFFTPGNSQGFGWHYDAEEVFILQTAGIKDFSLRKNTVNPWPVLETMPADMRYDRECMPLQRCRLQGGDWLYIPSGYWHQATAPEPSVSVSIGVLAPTALSLLDHLRSRLVDDIGWRRRLPPPGFADPASIDRLRSDLKARWNDLRRYLIDQSEDSLIDRFLERHYPRAEHEPPCSE